MSPEEEQKDVKKQGDKEAQDIADQLLADLLGNAPPAKKLETKPALAKEQKPAPAPPKVQPAEAPEPKPVEAT
ncbi:MAG: hypothetical protein QCI38_04585, partial [Candidatus Thermoplasmatota archaeon]|nr:hypothetical protein [Candidatus Thermoplasmatota archaeon]